MAGTRHPRPDRGAVPVQGQYHAFVVLAKTQLRRQFFKTVHVLGLVQQNLHAGVLHNGILDNGGGDDILEFLGHHHGRSPVLSRRLPQLHHIAGHLGAHNGFPGLFDDHYLEVGVGAHLLAEGIHNHQCGDGVDDFVALDMVNLKDHEAVVQDINALTGIQKVPIGPAGHELPKGYHVALEVEVLRTDLGLLQCLPEHFVQEGIVIVKHRITVMPGLAGHLFPSQQEFNDTLLQECECRGGNGLLIVLPQGSHQGEKEVHRFGILLGETFHVPERIEGNRPSFLKGIIGAVLAAGFFADDVA